MSTAFNEVFRCFYGDPEHCIIIPLGEEGMSTGEPKVGLLVYVFIIPVANLLF